jgi:anti-sigma factor RsiW
MSGEAMTACDHRVDGMLTAYVEGMLSLGDRAVVEEHLATCADCRVRARQLREVLPALRESVLHIPATVMAAYAANEPLAQSAGHHWTPDVVRAHLAQCAHCREDLAMLGRIRDELAIQANHVNVEPRVRTAYAPSHVARIAAMSVLAVAATIALMVLSPPSRTGTQTWMPVMSNVEVERLIAMTTRGSDAGAPIYPTETDAALAQMRQQLEWIEGGFRFRSFDSTGTPTHDGTEYRLRLTSPDGLWLGESTARMPVRMGAVVLLQFPNRDVLRLNVHPGDNLARLSASDVSGGCVVWTYATKSGYRSLPAFTFGSTR